MKDTHEQLLDFFEYLGTIYDEQQQSELNTHDKDMYI